MSKKRLLWVSVGLLIVAVDHRICLWINDHDHYRSGGRDHHGGGRDHNPGGRACSRCCSADQG